jgi:hypothetical protein
MNLVTQYRRRWLDKYIDVSKQVGLEIGPHNQPMVKKNEGPIKFLDYLNRSELIASDPHVSYLDDIPETDYIVKSNDYLLYVKDKFDYLIAAHVLEHAPNFIGSFQQFCEMLNPGGVLFIALPDKKFTFDKYRTNTMLSHVLYDYFNKVEKASIEHLIEDFLYYDRQFIGSDQNIEERLSLNLISTKVTTEPHIGLHCHVFQSETILDTLIKPILAMNLVKFILLEFCPASSERGGEMIMLFRKEQPTQQISEIEFLSTDRTIVG